MKKWITLKKKPFGTIHKKIFISYKHQKEESTKISFDKKTTEGLNKVSIKDDGTISAKIDIKDLLSMEVLISNLQQNPNKVDHRSGTSKEVIQDMRKGIERLFKTNKEKTTTYSNVNGIINVEVLIDEDLEPWSDIREFEEKIKDVDYVLGVISKGYLESNNCMYEMAFFYNEKKNPDKGFLPVNDLDEVSQSIIFEATGSKARNKYIPFWKNEKDNYLKDDEHASEKTKKEEREKFDLILSHIEEFLKNIKDKKVITTKYLEDENYKPILYYILKDSEKDIYDLSERLSNILRKDNTNRTNELDELKEKFKNDNEKLAYISFEEALFLHTIANNLEDAIKIYTEAIGYQPNYGDAYSNRGVAHSNLNDYEESIKDFTKAIDINPNYAEAYNNRGAVYAEMKEYGKSILDYTKAIDINPNYANAYSNRGNAYADMKKTWQSYSRLQ